MESNLPIASADCTSRLFKEMFPDSKIASEYHSGRTKTSCMINDCLADIALKDLLLDMTNNPFSMAVDGSSDQDLKKMHPMTVRIYDVRTKKVATRFLDMCLTDAADSESIFSAMDMALVKNGLNWDNCIALSVDNAAVNIGSRRSIKTMVIGKNSAIYIHGCPCHICHNGAKKGQSAFARVTNFDVEDMMVDLYYWFKYSQGRKRQLKEFCDFCDIEFKKVIKHLGVRWLSLEIAVNRTLTLYPALRSYFMSNEDSSQRFRRLQTLFCDEVTEVYLLFLQSILPVFINFNLTLQKEIPCAHILHELMSDFLLKLLGRFVKQDVLATSGVTECSVEDQVDDTELYIGFATEQMLNQSDSISDRQRKVFYSGVRAFFKASSEYLRTKLPFNEDILLYSSFVNLNNKHSNFTQVQYFCNRYKSILGLNQKTSM